MSHRTRVILVVAVALAAAAGVAGAAAFFGGDDEPQATRPEGNPPVLVDLGVRTDPEATRLRRAAGKHSHGDLAGARADFAGGRSLQAEAGEAISSWPDGTLERLEELATLHPRNGAVLFHLGLARFWSGDTTGAVEAWRTTRSRAPDTAFAVRAGDLLFRGAPPGLPTFVPGFRGPREVRAMEAPEQFAALQRMARRGDAARQAALRGGAPARRTPGLGAAGSSRPPQSWRRTTPTPWSPTRSGASTRSIPSAPSPAWGRSRGGFPAPAPSGSTSG